MIFCAATSVPAFAGIGENVISFRSEDTGAVGLMTEDGEIVAPAVFDGAGKFSHGICAMRLGNRYGYVGAEGLTLTAMNLRTARDFTATPAGTPYASVRFDEGWNLIDARGVAVFPNARPAEITDAYTLGLAAFYLDSRELVRDEETSGESFRDYAQTSVNNYLSFWYPKKEYETTQDWRARTTDEKLSLKVEELRRLAAARFVAERGDSAPVPADFKIVKYEADDSAFLLSHAKFGGVIVPVPRKEAARFRENFPGAKILAPEYGIGKNDRITLRSADFVMPDGKVYRADADAVFCDANTCYAGFKVELPGGAEPIDIPPRVVLSDVDRDVPALAPQPDRARFVCILANETYEKSANVLFAGEDGYAFEKYCEKTLGVPRERIVRSKNNSLGHMRRAVRDLAARAKVFPDAEIIFFYVGKSVADRYGNEYLLPTDCRPADGVRGGYRLKELYEELGALRAKLITVFLDSEICFTSTQGEGKGGGGRTLIELSDAVPAGNSVVFRSALAEESPSRFPENSHGLFTYFLLKKIKETRGNVGYAELADYLETQVKRSATERFDTTQTATATPSEELGDAWEKITIR